MRTMENIIHTRANALSSCPEGPVDSGIIYLHSMASQRMNERFNKYLDPFVNLCHACGYKPTSVLLPGGARLGGMTVVRM